MSRNESQRIELLDPPLRARGRSRVVRAIGDDAAVVRGDGVIVTSIDAVVDGVHFERATTPLAPSATRPWPRRSRTWRRWASRPASSTSRRAAGRRRRRTSSISSAPASKTSREACGATVAGGDLTASPVLWLAVTVVGYAASEDAVTGRDGAGAGDLVAVTGALGGTRPACAAVGLGRSLPSSAPKSRARCKTAPLPAPNFAAGRALAASGATAMIDISDGLARDAGQLAAASRLHATERLAGLPLAAGVEAVAAAAGADPHVFAAESGEEYELLCALPAARLDAAIAAVEATGQRLTVIGELTAPRAPAGASGTGSAVEFSDRQGRAVVVAGYDHFD